MYSSCHVQTDNLTVIVLNHHILSDVDTHCANILLYFSNELHVQNALAVLKKAFLKKKKKN